MKQKEWGRHGRMDIPALQIWGEYLNLQILFN